MVPETENGSNLVWNPTRYLIDDDEDIIPEYAIMLLNRPICLPYLDRLWNKGI